MKYDPLPGYYKYALNEGSFQNYIGDDGLLRVRARPNAAGGFYTHPVCVHNATWEMSLGWYSFFQYVGSLKGFEMKLIKLLPSDAENTPLRQIPREFSGSV